MYVLGAARAAILDCMPSQSNIAEIGVAEGGFSNEIVVRTMPRKLHLIDPWVHQAREDYPDDPNNVSQTEADRRYAGVCGRFEAEIEAGLVEVHRDFSNKVVDEFDDGYLDWVYVDAVHTYEGCLEDLRKYDRKVKKDGFICGHDYANHRLAQQMHFGVIEAVNQFVTETGYELTLLTYEPFPTYVIAKDKTSQRYMELLSAAFANNPILVEIDQAQCGSFRHVVVNHGNGKETFHYRFG